MGFIVVEDRAGRSRNRVIEADALIVCLISACCLTFVGAARATENEGPEPLSTATTFRAQSDGLPTDPRAMNGPPSPAGEPASGLAAPAANTGGFLDTAIESLFGEAPASDWTPLSIFTLFSEGWNQPFVFSPASDSGALRQEWIRAANGVFYRQWVLDYNFRDRTAGFRGRGIGTFMIFAPLSRRLELNISIPFVDYHPVKQNTSAAGGGPAAQSGYFYRATVGDLSITPQVLLSETRNTSIMSILEIRTPTGSRSAGSGGTSLGPQLQFWQGLPNRWVVRGGAGPTIPLTSTGLHTTFDTNLTVGRFLTLDDARYFKELTVWVAANNSAVMDHRGAALDNMTILPGLRFRIAEDTWFLYGVEVPLVAPRNEDYGMYFRLVRRW